MLKFKVENHIENISEVYLEMFGEKISDDEIIKQLQILKSSYENKLRNCELAKTRGHFILLRREHNYEIREYKKDQPNIGLDLVTAKEYIKAISIAITDKTKN